MIELVGCTEDVCIDLCMDDGTCITVQTDAVTVGGVSDYNALINKPAINGVELIGSMTLDDFGLSEMTEEQVESYWFGEEYNGLSI